MKRTKRGYTLIEICIVLAVVLILVALLLPVVGRIREKGHQTSCRSNIRQMNSALRQYVSDYDSSDLGQYNWQEALMPYIKDKRIYECPSESRSENSAQTGMDTDYFYFAVSNKFESGKYIGVNEASQANVDSSKILTFADSPFGEPSYQTKAQSSCGGYFVPDRHSGGGNWGFADGHVKWLAPQAGADAICFGYSIPK